MKLYSLVHEIETTENKFLHKTIVREVGVGLIVEKLRSVNDFYHYQYIVFEYNEMGDLMDHQRADEWIEDYEKTLASEINTTENKMETWIVNSMSQAYPELVDQIRRAVQLGGTSKQIEKLVKKSGGGALLVNSAVIVAEHFERGGK